MAPGLQVGVADATQLALAEGDDAEEQVVQTVMLFGMFTTFSLLKSS